LTYLAIAIVVSSFLFPPVWMILTSFKRPLDVIAYPPKILFSPSLDNWYWFLFSTEITAISPQEGRRIITEFLPNSLIIATSTMILTVTLASLGAYSLARFEFLGKKPIAFAIIGTRMLPPIATAIPLFIFMSNLHLRDTHICLVLAYTALNIPLILWMLWGFIREIPIDIEESAMIDGCTRLGALFRIVFPVITPGLAAAGIMSFIWAWNDFALALFLVAQRAKTMPLAALGFYAEEGINWGPMSAYGTVYVIPTIIFSLVVQKHIIKGLTLGAVKT
jgi:multiple sugar transport system permease protein